MSHQTHEIVWEEKFLIFQILNEFWHTTVMQDASWEYAFVLRFLPVSLSGNQSRRSSPVAVATHHTEGRQSPPLCSCRLLTVKSLMTACWQISLYLHILCSDTLRLTWALWENPAPHDSASFLLAQTNTSWHHTALSNRRLKLTSSLFTRWRHRVWVDLTITNVGINFLSLYRFYCVAP